MPSAPKKTFADKLAATYRDVPLPAVYWRFFSEGEYLRYPKAFVRTLENHGPDPVEINLVSSTLLKWEELLDDSDLDPDDAKDYHPMAVLPQASEFLAIDKTKEEAPVFLWNHETGRFHPQYESFDAFKQDLMTAEEVRAQKAEIRKLFGGIKKQCGAALAKGQKLFDANELDKAAKVVDAALEGRAPIEYDGMNDFEAIGTLASCYVLRGRILVKQGHLRDALDYFVKGLGCGGQGYNDAAADAIAAGFLLGDLGVVFELVGTMEDYHFTMSVPLSARDRMLHAYTEQQLEQVKQAALSPSLAEPYRAFGAKVAGWLAAASRKSASGKKRTAGNKPTAKPKR